MPLARTQTENFEIYRQNWTFCLWQICTTKMMKKWHYAVSNALLADWSLFWATPLPSLSSLVWNSPLKRNLPPLTVLPVTQRR